VRGREEGKGREGWAREKYEAITARNVDSPPLLSVILTINLVYVVETSHCFDNPAMRYCWLVGRLGSL